MKTSFYRLGTCLFVLAILLCPQAKVLAQRGGFNWAKDG